MQVANNLIFSSQSAADGQWRNINNFMAYSVYFTGLEGNVWVEVSNDPSVMTDGASSLAAPAAPTLTQFLPTFGGLTGQGTYYVKTTYVTATGETLPSTERSLAVSDGLQLSVASPAASGNAVGWNCYVGSATGKEHLQNANPLIIGQPFNLAALTTFSSVVPASNTAGSAAIGINVSGNLAGTALAGDETEIVQDTINHLAIFAPSCLVFNYLRIRKDNSAQTKVTSAYLFGQIG